MFTMLDSDKMWGGDHFQNCFATLFNLFNEASLCRFHAKVFVTTIVIGQWRIAVSIKVVICF